MRAYTNNFYSFFNCPKEQNVVAKNVPVSLVFTCFLKL